MVAAPLGVTGPATVRRRLALALGAGLLGVCSAASLAPVAAAPAGAYAASYAAPDGSIDTSSKAAVREAWQTRMEPNLDVASGWTGSVDDCTPGHPSDAAQTATRDSVNFARAMAGLDPVGFNGKLNRQAQAAALMMDANDALSHDPPSSWSCWTQIGHDAAGHSNIAVTSGEMHAGQSVQLYLDDPGAGNRAAGHRRWVLNPYVDTMGNGLTQQADALYVLGPTDSANTNPAWVSWPTKGWFPGPLEPGGRWSLASGDSTADFSHATVVVKRGTTTKTRLKVTRFTPVTGYGQPTLVFQVAKVKPTGTYTVVVRGIRGGGPAKHRYVVRLFTP